MQLKLRRTKNIKRRKIEVLKEHDFSSLRKKGISEGDLEELVERMILPQEMIKEMGLKKAKTLRMKFSKTIVHDYLGSMFPTSEYLKQCEGGFLPSWKKFLIKFVDESGKKGIQSGTITEPSPGIIKQDMNYCAFAEIAEILGDRELCYWTSCITDDYFFPKHMKKGGCCYTRSTTLATGTVCDFCYKLNSCKNE